MDNYQLAILPELAAPPEDLSDLLASISVLMSIAGLSWHSPLVLDWWVRDDIGKASGDMCDRGDLELIEERLLIGLIDGGLGRV